jgi:hypothetical protein
MDPAEVFVHRGYPEYTYVERKNPTEKSESFEDQLYSALRRNYHVKISGPSKSGKTQLVRKVVRERLDKKGLVKIKGSNIDSTGDLSSQAVDILPVSSEVSKTEANQETSSIKAKISARLGLTSTEVSGDVSQTEIQEYQEVERNNEKSLRSLLQSIDGEEFVVLIDNFHYIEKDVRKEILEAIRDLETNFCMAMIPYRMDDIYIGNQDLQGRVQSIEMNYWGIEELEEIGNIGFAKLNINLTDNTISRLANESVGSPQIMQQMCQTFCVDILDIDEKYPEKEDISTSTEEVERVAKKIVSTAQVEKIFRKLKSGKETRGEERVGYPLNNGIGDGYTCVLRGVRRDPVPEDRIVDINELEERIDKEIEGEVDRRKQNISNDCENMAEIMEDEFPNKLSIEWDDTEGRLAISNPYLLFYIRWVNKEKLTDSERDVSYIKTE